MRTVLKNHVLEGLRACAERVAPEQETPASVAIDTWGVDFVLLDEAMNRIGDAVAYRDGRTAGVPEKLEAVLPFAELYARTGIQQQVYNTVYQLWALRQEAPEQLERAAHFLMMPNYLGFVLSGVCANEYTIASTSALLNAREKTWDQEILRRIGVPGADLPPGADGRRSARPPDARRAVVGRFRHARAPRAGPRYGFGVPRRAGARRKRRVSSRAARGA